MDMFFVFFLSSYGAHLHLHSFPTRRSSDLEAVEAVSDLKALAIVERDRLPRVRQWRSKSTRLNSSHVSISYAVFCLKKKSILRSASSRGTPLPTKSSANCSICNRTSVTKRT